MTGEHNRPSPYRLGLNLVVWRNRFASFALGSFFAGVLILLLTAANLNDQLGSASLADHHWSVWPLLTLGLSGLMFALCAAFTFGALAAHAVVAIFELPLPPLERRQEVKAEQVNWYGSGNR
jgi:hypothetical protein